ncbi:hypothetical protein ACIPVB_00365 [Microbacterium sp. NPDC090007]|uniref:hypothetical protein n=1 Tax=Microbacterium sp. NPDC090007 TaxID=3364204 RepID=UPI0037F9E6D4
MNARDLHVVFAGAASGALSPVATALSELGATVTGAGNPLRDPFPAVTAIIDRIGAHALRTSTLANEVVVRLDLLEEQTLAQAFTGNII